MGQNVSAVVVEQGNFVVGLVKLGGEDDVVPYGQADIVVQQLVGERRLDMRRMHGREGTHQPVSDCGVHGAATDIDDVAVAEERFGQRAHAWAEVWRREDVRRQEDEGQRFERLDGLGTWRVRRGELSGGGGGDIRFYTRIGGSIGRLHHGRVGILYLSNERCWKSREAEDSHGSGFDNDMTGGSVSGGGGMGKQAEAQPSAPRPTHAQRRRLARAGPLWRLRRG